MTYSTQVIANYNASPPADDGSTAASNEITWAKHKTKLADPVKTLAEALNTELLTVFPTTDGTVEANTVLVVDATKTLDTLDLTELKLGTVAVTSTAAEVNQLDASARAVTNYVSGAVNHIHDDGSHATEFAAHNVIGAAWESVGPTSSGADNIWTGMDDIPAGATYVILRIYNVVIGSTSVDVYSNWIYGRGGGSSSSINVADTLISITQFTNQSGGSERDANITTVFLPLDSNLTFDLYIDVEGVSSTNNAQFNLVGWGE